MAKLILAPRFLILLLFLLRNALFVTRGLDRGLVRGLDLVHRLYLA